LQANQNFYRSAPSVPSSVAAPFSEGDFVAFQQKVKSKTGIALDQYKSDQMRRRIASLAERSGCTSFTAYGQLMDRDVSTLEAFLDRMTINVTELMRNPDHFEDLKKNILPMILANRRTVPLSIWSAGCSYGAEAYTMAMLIHELDTVSQHKIKGTDIDLAILTKAERPFFSDADMVNVSPARREANFHECCGSYQPKIHLKQKVRFAPHDLLSDPYPKAEYDIILCRNVVIYFTDEAKEAIYRGMYQALRPGGILFVGGTERIASRREIGFNLLKSFFYQKPG
jgi:chemotaxis protein methyltransferase CheR